MTILVRLPHFIVAAVAAEEVGKAAGSTKLRGLGLPLPYTDKDGTTGVVRLWARWEKQRDGAAKLLGFDVRNGKERSGDRMLELRIRAHDGALVGHAPGRISSVWKSYPGGCSTRRQPASRRPAGRVARNVVTQAKYASCCCCGRLLTDPVSVKTGIGPECGETFHKLFLERWRAARQQLAA